MNPTYKITSLREVIKQVNPSQPLFVDTETDGLYGPVKTVQFMQQGWESTAIVLDPSLPTLMVVLDMTTVIFQNGSYDISTIQRQSKTRYIPKSFEDLFLLGRLFYYAEESHSLDNLILCSIGFDPYAGQGIDKKEMQKFNWSKATAADISSLCQYGATDVFYMPAVYETVKHHELDDNYKLDMLALRHALDFQNNGMPVLEVDRKIMEMELQNEVNEMNMPINVNSYIQVPEYLGTENSKDLTLAIAELNGMKEAGRVRKAKKLLKRISYLNKCKTEDERIYGVFSPSARSGRFTCSKDNLQQLPHEIQSIFGYTPKDKKLITYSDFSQLELRDLCAVIGERTMEALYREGKDLHVYARENIPGLKDREDGRQIGKTCNFLLLYYGSAQILSDELASSAGIRFHLDERLNIIKVNEIRNNWRNLYPDMKNWQDNGVKAWKKGRPNKTPLGRRFVGKRMTDHLNIEIQGSSADVAKLALHYICSGLPSIDPECRLINFQHDSYMIEHPDDKKIINKVQALVGESMQESWKVNSKLFRIHDLPMPVKVYTGYKWGGIEKNHISKMEFE